MNEFFFYQILLFSWLLAGLPIFISLFFISAPYGRYSRKGWGPLLGNKLAWLLMESPSAIIFLILFIVGNQKNITAWIFLLLWESHYIHRAFIYPLQRRGSKKQMPLSIVFFSILFNSVNTYLNARWLFLFSKDYPSSWPMSFQFIIGLAFFITGFIINRKSDLILISLRRTTDDTYKIPHGGLYKLISCPNYLGEIIEWIGWGIATWSLAGTSFAFWTFVNLVPRAIAHHHWYKETFSNYPSNRKAIIPFLW